MAKYRYNSKENLYASDGSILLFGEKTYLVESVESKYLVHGENKSIKVTEDFLAENFLLEV